MIAANKTVRLTDAFAVALVLLVQADLAIGIFQPSIRCLWRESTGHRFARQYWSVFFHRVHSMG